MRYGLLTFILGLVVSPIGFAGEQDGYIRIGEVALYSTSNANSPEVVRLGKNHKLRIHHEEGDFYAVLPPAGSVSWVRGAYLRFVPEKAGGPTVFPVAAVVDSNGQAKSRHGRVNLMRPLEVQERTEVLDGTAVTIIGQKVDIDGIKWYPISSLEDDFRYVPKNAIDFGRPTELRTAALKSNNSQAYSNAATNSLVNSPENSRVSQGWSHSTWLEAQTAEKAGELERAEKLYLNLAREMMKAGGNEKVTEDCYARVHELREKRRKAGGQNLILTSHTGEPSVGEFVKSQEKERTNSSPIAVSPSNSTLTNSSLTNSSLANSSSSKSEQEGRWEGPGTIYASSLRVNSQKVYALQSTPDRVIAYLVSGPNVDLSKYVGKYIRVYGQSKPLTGYPDKTLMTVREIDVDR
jgi:hypothetical protein